MTTVSGGFPGLGLRGRGHGVVVWARVRRGVWPVGAGLLTGLLVYATLTATSDPPSDWFATGAEIHGALTVLQLVSVPLACWQGGLEARAGTGWTVECAVRGPWTTTLLSLAPSLLWPCAMFGALVTVLLARAWPHAAVGSPPLAAVAYSAALLITMAGLGHVLGCLLPLRIVPVLLGAALYAQRLGSFGEDVLGVEYPTQRAYDGPTLPGDGWFEESTSPWLPWAVPALLVTVVLAAVAVRARRRLAAGLLLLALVLFAVVRPLGGAVLEPGVGTIPVHCSNDTPVVCVSADREAQRSELADVADHFGRRIDGVRGAPTHYLATADTTFGRAFAADEEAWTAEIELGSPRATRFRNVANDIAEPHWIYDPAYESHRDLALVKAVTDWLLPAPYRPKDRSPRVRRLTARLTALPKPTRTAWLSRYLTAVQNMDDRLPQLPKAETP